MQISNRFGGQGVPGWKEDYGPEPNRITDAEDDLPGESGRDAALTWTTSKTSGLFTTKGERAVRKHCGLLDHVVCHRGAGKRFRTPRR